MGKLYCITSYQVCHLQPASLDVGDVWRDSKIPHWKLWPSDSYRVWNYVWGEDPDA